MERVAEAAANEDYDASEILQGQIDRQQAYYNSPIKHDEDSPPLE
jgi:hypothetical protein